MQILSCSSTLGTCCGDHGLVLIIDTARKVMGLIQLVIPIILILMATIELTKLAMDPDAKNGVKKIINKFFAAAIVFFIPVFINATMSLVDTDLRIKACWDQAKNKAEVAHQNSTYKNPYEGEQETKPLLPKPDAYESGKPKPSSAASTWTGGTVTGEDIVAYAMQFKGMGYRLGCHWDGNLPYQNASCIGFIVGLYKHFGIKVPCTEDTDMYLKDPSKFTVVTNGPHRPGDIVIFDGHYAMLTGNGNEIIHSTSTDGIIVSKNYLKSGQNVLGIVHVNVVQ